MIYHKLLVCTFEKRFIHTFIDVSLRFYLKASIKKSQEEEEDVEEEEFIGTHFQPVPVLFVVRANNTFKTVESTLIHFFFFLHLVTQTFVDRWQ